MNKSSGTAKKLLDIIHFLNPILPNLCKAVGVKRKNAHCLPVFFFCMLKLSYNGVKEKLIREREREAGTGLVHYLPIRKQVRTKPLRHNIH